ncbi:MAG: sulfurtransferase TusA family protein [Paracoccaceae bacterium]
MIEDLDATGLKCPLPVLRLRKRLIALEPGARLRVLADDPVAVVDIPHFCAEEGHAIEDRAERDGIQHYLIRKGPV